MAALTITRVAGPFSTGDRFETVTSVVLSSSYPTGGEVVTPALLGFASTVDPQFQVQVEGGHGYGPEYDYTNQKIIVYTSAGTQTTNATDLSAVTLYVRATGRYKG